MKRAIMALLFSYIATQACQSQDRSCMAGLDLTSFLHGSTQAEVSYSFDRHWSLTGMAYIPYKKLAKGKTELETEHEGEFSSAGIPVKSHYQNSTIMLDYWPKDAFNGPFISVGIQAGISTDIITEAGYTLPIWKDICLSISLHVPIIQSMKEDGIDSRNIKIGINYRF